MKIFCSYTAGNYLMGWQRADIFQSLGHQVYRFQDDHYSQRSLYLRVKNKINTQGPPFSGYKIEKFNSDIAEQILIFKPDLVWIEKALLLRPNTLHLLKSRLPKCIFICFQDDDPFGLRHYEYLSWVNFIECIPAYDICIVPKKINVTEFIAAGAKRVLEFRGGYNDLDLNKIVSENDYPLRDINLTFIGSALDHRVKFLQELILSKKTPISVYGGLWNRTYIYYRKPKLFYGRCNQTIYLATLRSSKISLGFVSHTNRDQYNGRSFDIPAYGSFFLAERTPTHLELYKEGCEAEFFDSVDECSDKINFYLKNDHARKKIANAGQLRCFKSGYSLSHSLSHILKKIITEVRN